MHRLRSSYLLYLGDVQLKSDAKTAFGLRDWCRDKVLGQWTRQNAAVDLELPRLNAQQAAQQGAGSLIIGVAPVGGALPEHWLDDLESSLDAGLDLVSGLHTRLNRIPRLVAAAQRNNVRLLDVRHSDAALTAGTGIKRSGKRLLTVGTDCALGKKYTALALADALRQRGVAADFRATGQTGIMIAGEGIAIDAVIADFIAGAAEQLSPDNVPDHWDVIEGQGALFHPAYAGVTLGLLHGSQPDAIVLCHDPSRETIEGYPHIRLPSLGRAIEAYLDAGRLTNRAIRCVGISINASALTPAQTASYFEQIGIELGLPICDPIKTGVGAIVDELLRNPHLP